MAHCEDLHEGIPPKLSNRCASMRMPQDTCIPYTPSIVSRSSRSRSLYLSPWNLFSGSHGAGTRRPRAALPAAGLAFTVESVPSSPKRQRELASTNKVSQRATKKDSGLPKNGKLRKATGAPSWGMQTAEPCISHHPTLFVTGL
jgi:hypothetical protein